MSIRHHLFKIWNLYPPFLGAGIWIESVSPQFDRIKVVLKRRKWTSNYVGTQFGGSIFMMTDPFFMVSLIHRLGPGYIVWDKAASIRYLKPGRTKLTAEFILDNEKLSELRARAEGGAKFDWLTQVQVKDLNGEVIAEVEKVIYIRKK